MGDFFSPQKRELVERLRRRIDGYRQTHIGSIAKYQKAFDVLYQQQRNDTGLLHQKWLDSKAKKASKNSRASKDGLQGNQPSNNKKRKIDSTSSAASEVGPDPSMGHGDTQSPVNKRAKTESDSKAQLSVRIESSQAGARINVVVDQAFNPGKSPSTSRQGLRTSTSVECKPEPFDENLNPTSNTTHSPQESDIGDPLADILDILNNDTNESDIHEILDNLDSDNLDFNGMLSPGSMHNTSPPAPPPQYSNSFSTNSNDNGPVYSSHGGHSTPPVPVSSSAIRHYHQPSHPPSVSQDQRQNTTGSPYYEPTGPAAETLKQLAAARNSHGGPPTAAGYSRQPSYPGYPAHLPPSSQQHMYRYSDPQHQMAQHKAQESLSYSSTKPLSHFPDPMGQGVPPQHRQIRGPTPPQGMPIHVNQIQSMTVGHSQQIQMTQEMHVNIGQGQSQAYKLQQEQAMMSQYPQRGPPPEYKTTPGAHYQQAGPNHPLQPIQNMIKQTNETFNTAVQHGGIYGQVKTEEQQHNAMYNTVKTETQRIVNIANVPSVSHMPPVRNNSPMVAGPNQSHIDGYPGQPLSRQHSYPGMPSTGLPLHSAPMQHTVKTSAPSYTSALMRNERPPNVNVGPGGLNISQQRSLPSEWTPRPSTPSYQGGMRPGYPPQSMQHIQQQRPQLSYSNYPGVAQMRPSLTQHQSLNMQIMQQQQQQQQAMMRGSIQNTMTPSNMHMQQQQQMMMSQNIRMQQHQHSSGGIPQNMNMSQSVAMATNHSSASFLPQNSGEPNFPDMNFMDAQRQGYPDINFDSLDDILGM